MTTVKIYLYSNCSSCKNAETILKNSAFPYDRRDFFKDKLTVEEIAALLAEIRQSPFDVLSRRSIPYRNLDLANRSVTEAELIAYMAEFPGLLKRPIVIKGNTVLIGFNRAALEALVTA